MAPLDAKTMEQAAASGVINPYLNQEVVHHKKYISHLGIAFLDLKYSEKRLMKSQRTVLRKICGQLNYGTVVAILGPHKSGKTTLLKCLCGRLNDGIDCQTQLYVNQDVPLRIVYLEKEIANNIMLCLSPAEACSYTYRFRNPTVRSVERKAAIKQLLIDLQLIELADIPLIHLPAEEQIKAQIAVALCSYKPPNMICLDEPLMMLDAVGVDNVIHLMKTLCRQYSITFCCSIGTTPDSDILAVFDKLYVLSRGGLCVYEGSVDHLNLFLRESDIIITSKIETPFERLMKIASKPDQQTLRLANRIYSTRDEIFDQGNKYGKLAMYGIQTRLRNVNIFNMYDLFVRCLINKWRRHWKLILLQICTFMSFSFVLVTGFNTDIGQPDGCLHRYRSKKIDGLVVILNDTINEEDLTRNSSLQNFEFVHNQNDVEQNVKLIFLCCASLTLFQMVTSMKLLHDELKAVINEHRNGRFPIFDSC